MGRPLGGVTRRTVRAGRSSRKKTSMPMRETRATLGRSYRRAWRREARTRTELERGQKETTLGEEKDATRRAGRSLRGGGEHADAAATCRVLAAAANGPQPLPCETPCSPAVRSTDPPIGRRTRVTVAPEPAPPTAYARVLRLPQPIHGSCSSRARQAARACCSRSPSPQFYFPLRCLEALVYCSIVQTVSSKLNLSPLDYA